jgi:hypothetical protein
MIKGILRASINPQRGALFAMDARIALTVFSLLSVIAGAAMVLNLNESRAKGLVAELVDTARAIEAFHQDLRTDIFLALTEPSEAKAFQALYDASVIVEADNLRARWNGPYVRAVSNRNPIYGVMSLQKRGPNHTKPCDAETPCFLWLMYDEVQPEITLAANEMLDGPSEPAPESNGRLQWSQTDDTTRVLYYRATKALNWTDTQSAGALIDR